MTDISFFRHITGVFPEKLCTIDLNDITMETVEFINSNFITHPEWDVLAAGKVLVLAEVLGKWMFAIKVRNFVIEGVACQLTSS